LRGDPEEVSPALPSHGALIDEFEKGLVHERCGLQRVIAPLVPEIAGGEPPELGVDLRQQTVERLLAPVAPLLKKLRDVGAIGFHEQRSLGLKIIVSIPLNARFPSQNHTISPAE
jgi:hypothetical protein